MGSTLVPPAEVTHSWPMPRGIAFPPSSRSVRIEAWMKPANAPLLEDARRREELVESILLALTLCGAALNGQSIRFARGIADVMIWSAKHAIHSAVHRGDHEEGPEWQ